MRATDPVDRIFDRVRISRLGCWELKPTKARYINVADSRVAPAIWKGAHVWVWEHFNGPVPEGLVLDHICRVRHCVNPAHLEPVPQQINVLRGQSPAAVRAAKTHCHRDHPLSGDNVVLNGRGSRVCLACRKINNDRTNALARA